MRCLQLKSLLRLIRLCPLSNYVMKIVLTANLSGTTG